MVWRDVPMGIELGELLHFLLFGTEIRTVVLHLHDDEVTSILSSFEITRTPHSTGR